jgi:hypothetical protein
VSTHRRHRAGSPAFALVHEAKGRRRPYCTQLWPARVLDVSQSLMHAWPRDDCDYMHRQYLSSHTPSVRRSSDTDESSAGSHQDAAPRRVEHAPRCGPLGGQMASDMQSIGVIRADEGTCCSAAAAC